MKWSTTTRRHFLQGPGKAALALPVLHSLLPRGAQAQTVQKNFFGFPINNGVANQYNNSAAEAATAPSTYMPALTNMQTFAGPSHPISSKTLAAARADGNNAAGTNKGGQISEFFGPEFNPYLPKMNMLLGFDWFLPGSDHHRSHFGNAHQGVEFGATEAAPAVATATIDQVLAYSRSFYKNPALIGKSASYLSQANGDHYSWTFSNPNDLKSPIVAKPVTRGPAALWDTFFNGFTPPPPGAPPPPPGPSLRSMLVDQVLVDYNALRKNPRLGHEDKARVDLHIALLHNTETQVKAAAPPPPPVGCKPATRVAEPADVKLDYQTMNSVAVSAAACGLANSFLTSAVAYVTPGNGCNWHAWSHGNGSNPVVNEHDQIKRCLSEIVLDLVTKLDQAGLLDNSLVMVPTEHTRGTHATISLPVVTFGSAGGTLKTGQFIDYRNWATGTGDANRAGYPMNTLFANVLMAMGLPPAEFEALNRNSNASFAPANSGYSNLGASGRYPGLKGKSLSDWLPLLKA